MTIRQGAKRIEMSKPTLKKFLILLGIIVVVLGVIMYN